MRGLYLLALLVSIGGLAALDRHFRLAFFYKPRQTALILVCAVALFVVWDLAGLYFRIFFSGPSPLLIGWQLAPEFPVEEIGFLTLLNYNALLLWTWLRSRHA